ncbi:MAG: hypothetical protein U0599_12415 [Vicinamibacteria bacterium]
MRERAARVALGVACGLLLVAAAVVDLPTESDGRFWSDAATYHAAAGSVAFDGDVEFRPEDLARVRAAWSSGPQGVFLKRVASRAGGTRLVYAKPLLHPIAAAPLVRLLGVDRGLLVLNALVLGGALVAGFVLLRERSGPLGALAGTFAVFGAGVAPAYLFWETPELFYLGLAAFGLVAWRRGHPLVAALLLGAAAYGKPTNGALALPLVLEPLLDAVSRRAWRGGLVEALRRGVVVTAVFASGFAVNVAATGEMNYQGGERKTFHDRYPFDPGVTFDDAGVWMTTDHVGPLVAGRDDEKSSSRVAPPRSREELRQSFRLNLGYFWVGRFGGVLPYYPGFAVALALFLLAGPRDRVGWLALLAVAVSWIGYLLIIPDNWYGGGGTIGNRYFLNVLPLALLLLPRGREAWAAAAALPVAAWLVFPMIASPVRHARHPGDHALRPAFRVLPAELTMLGDLSVFTDVWRRRRPYHLPGGDPSRRAPGDPPPYYLWFIDDGTFGQESSFGQEGFWLRGGERAEVLLQAFSAPKRVRLVVTTGPAGDIVTARLGAARERVVLPPLKTRELAFDPGEGVGYYGTRVYRLALDSRYGGGAGQDRRALGSFVRVVLE